jgi:hypothetical protein
MNKVKNINYVIKNSIIKKNFYQKKIKNIYNVLSPLNSNLNNNYTNNHNNFI